MSLLKLRMSRLLLFIDSRKDINEKKVNLYLFKINFNFKYLKYKTFI
jgi:hypothetical protein